MVHSSLNRSLLSQPLRWFFFPFSYALLRSPAEGARPVVFLASSQRVEGRGGGFWAAEKGEGEEGKGRKKVVQVREVPCSEEALDTVLAHRVWMVSEALVEPFL